MVTLLWVFHSLHELTHLQRITGWRRRVSTAVAFIIEFWPPSLPRSRDYIRLLRDFDHVWVFNRWSLPVLSELVGVPCSYLPPATDTLRFSPRPTPPPRMIDVYSYGRRNAIAHQVLPRRAGPGFYCLYQTTDGSTPLTHNVEHRELPAHSLQRSRLIPGVNDSGRRFFSITTKISRRDPRPCPHEYHPPIVYTPRSTRCSPPVTTWRPPWSRWRGSVPSCCCRPRWRRRSPASSAGTATPARPAPRAPRPVSATATARPR